jgi:hypothetical protein
MFSVPALKSVGRPHVGECMSSWVESLLRCCQRRICPGLGEGRMPHVWEGRGSELAVEGSVCMLVGGVFGVSSSWELLKCTPVCVLQCHVRGVIWVVGYLVEVGGGCIWWDVGVLWVGDWCRSVGRGVLG